MPAACLQVEQAATIDKLSAQTAQQRAANESLQKLLDSKELDFSHAQAALKRRVEALESQLAHAGDKLRRVEGDKVRLEDMQAHSSARLVSLEDQVSETARAKEALVRQVKTLKEEAAAAAANAETVERNAQFAVDALEGKLAAADQARMASDKALRAELAEAECARSRAEGEASTLRSEVKALKQVVGEQQKEAGRAREALVRMEGDVGEAAGQKSRVSQSEMDGTLGLRWVHDLEHKPR